MAVTVMCLQVLPNRLDSLFVSARAAFQRVMMRAVRCSVGWMSMVKWSHYRIGKTASVTGWWMHYWVQVYNVTLVGNCSSALPRLTIVVCRFCRLMYPVGYMRTRVAP